MIDLSFMRKVDNLDNNQTHISSLSLRHSHKIRVGIAQTWSYIQIMAIMI